MLVPVGINPDRSGPREKVEYECRQKTRDPDVDGVGVKVTFQSDEGYQSESRRIGSRRNENSVWHWVDCSL